MLRPLCCRSLRFLWPSPTLSGELGHVGLDLPYLLPVRRSSIRTPRPVARPWLVLFPLAAVLIGSLGPCSVRVLVAAPPIGRGVFYKACLVVLLHVLQ